MPAITFITKDEYNRNPKKWRKKRSAKINSKVEIRIIDDAEEQKMEQEVDEVVSSLSSTVSTVQNIEQQLEEVAHEYQEDVYVHHVFGGFSNIGGAFGQGRIVKQDEDAIAGKAIWNGVYVIFLNTAVSASDFVPWAELHSSPVIIDNPYVSGEKVRIVPRVECMAPNHLNHLHSYGIMQENYYSPWKAVVASCVAASGSTPNLNYTFAFYILEDWYSMSGDYLGTYHWAGATPRVGSIRISHSATPSTFVHSSSAYNLTIKLTRYNIPKPVKAIASAYSSGYYGYGSGTEAIGLSNL